MNSDEKAMWDLGTREQEKHILKMLDKYGSKTFEADIKDPNFPIPQDLKDKYKKDPSKYAMPIVTEWAFKKEDN